MTIVQTKAFPFPKRSDFRFFFYFGVFLLLSLLFFVYLFGFLWKRHGNVKWGPKWKQDSMLLTSLLVQGKCSVQYPPPQLFRAPSSGFDKYGLFFCCLWRKTKTLEGSSSISKVVCHGTVVFLAFKLRMNAEGVKTWYFIFAF